MQSIQWDQLHKVIKVEVKQSCYRPAVAQRVPGIDERYPLDATIYLLL